MTAILEARGLTKRFGQTLALDDVTLSVGAGRIVGLLGPNGSGKTTLIKLANGLLVPSGGELLIDGRPPGIGSARIVSYLPDRMYFEGHMRVKGCIEMFSDFYGDFDEGKARGMLRSLGVDAEAHLRSLSKGSQERVQLALVMSRAAKLYLLDEPIGGVDPAAREFIISTILRNYAQDAAVVISTHLIGEVEKVLDDVIFLSQGRLLEAQSADAIREREGKSLDEVFREVFRC